MDTQQPKKFKVLLIGDSCIDEYYYGTCDRLNPEAPVPILNFKRKEHKPGMAANVHANLVALGADVVFKTNSEKIIKTRYIDQRTGQHLLRMDNEDVVRPFADKIADLQGFDALVFSDYNKGFVTYDLIEGLIKHFRGPVFIDTKKTDLERFQSAWVKINELEYSKITSECSGLIVTRGANGASVIHHDINCSAPKVEIGDVCGAGDTFLSALAVEYLNTNDIEQAVKFAIKAASITVQHSGVYAPTLKEIL